MGKFSSKLAKLSQPLRELLTNDNGIHNNKKKIDFTQVKEELCKPSLLSLYNPNAETKLTGNASSYGFGAVLQQKHNSVWRPVAFASRSMTKIRGFSHYMGLRHICKLYNWIEDTY